MLPRQISSRSAPSLVRCLLHARPSAAPLSPRSNHRQSFGSSPLSPLAQPYNEILDELWLNNLPARFSPTDSWRTDVPGRASSKQRPPDERTIKLGKTLRILSQHLPNLLVSPLPQDIVSSNVSLHLFPSTHPHLPTVRGRALYRAALWTVPVAWSSLPLVGNVKLQIESERIVRAGTSLDADKCGNNSDGDERLVVRWKTELRSDDHTSGTVAGTNERSQTGENNSHSAASKAGINKGLSVLLGGGVPIFKLSKEEQFTGLFIFAFDEEGRISTHTIEHTHGANRWDRPSKFVTLTDWLIGKAMGSLQPSPGLAMQGWPDTELLRTHECVYRR